MLMTVSIADCGLYRFCCVRPEHVRTELNSDPSTVYIYCYVCFKNSSTPYLHAGTCIAHPQRFTQSDRLCMHCARRRLVRDRAAYKSRCIGQRCLSFVFVSQRLRPTWITNWITSWCPHFLSDYTPTSNNPRPTPRHRPGAPKLNSASHIMDTASEPQPPSAGAAARIFAASADEEICISGVSGQFPSSRNVAEFEENLYSKVRPSGNCDRRRYVSDSECELREGG